MGGASKSQAAYTQSLSELVHALVNAQSAAQVGEFLGEFREKTHSNQLSIHLTRDWESANLESLPFEPTLLAEHLALEAGPLSVNAQMDPRPAKLALSLEFNGEVFGSLILARNNEPYTQSEIALANDLSKLVGIIIQHFLLDERQAFQQKMITLIASVTSQLAHILSLDELTREICRLIRSTFGYYYVAVFTVDSAGEKLRFHASASDSTAGQPLFETLAASQLVIGEHLVGWVAHSGETLLANDVSQEPRYFALDTLPETQSELAIPLKIGSTVEGVLDLQSDRLGAFSKEDLLVLSSLADSLAISIHRVRLFGELKQRTDQLDLIARVNESISSILDLDKLLRTVTDSLHQDLGYPYVHIFLKQYVNNRLEYYAGSGGRAEFYESNAVSIDLSSPQGLIATAALLERPILVNDVSSDSVYIPNPYTHSAAGSELCLPLIFGTNILGVLDVQSDEINAFSQDDVDLLTTLAPSIAVALRNANLYKSEIWRRRVAENLRDVAVLVSQNTSITHIFTTVIQKIQEILPSDLASIWLLDETPEGATQHQPGILRLAACRSNSPDYTRSVPLLVAPEQSWLYQALGANQPLVRPPDAAADPIMTLYQLPDSCSSIATRLFTGSQQLGLLVLHEHSHGRYGQESQGICASFASYLSMALENKQLAGESLDQAWISTILLQVALATQSLTTIAELTETIGQLVMLLIGGKSGGVVLLDAEKQSHVLENLFGDGSEELKRSLPVELVACPELRYVTESRQVMAMPASQFNREVAGMFQCDPSDSVLLFPLVAHNEPLGVLMHISSEPYQPLEPEQVLGKQKHAILQGIAQQAALSIQSIKLLETRQEETFVSNVLLQISKWFVSSANLSDALDLIVGALPMLTGVQGLAILERNEDGTYFVRNLYSDRIRSWQSKKIIGGAFPTENLPDLDEFSPAQPYIIKSSSLFESLDIVMPDDSNRQDPESALPADEKSTIIFFPLSVRGQAYGLMVVRDPDVPKREYRIELLSSVAQQISVAVQNTHLKSVQNQQELVDRELHLARQIQRNFLPDFLPNFPGYDLGVQWQTARQVGGDFYDIFELRPGHFGIVIADVSDKGMAAALYMTVSRTLIRAMAEGQLSPALTLEKVNNLLQKNSSQGFFVTAFYGILELETGHLTYANAGHNPPILLSGNTRVVQSLPYGGIALGIFDEIKLPEKTLQLEHGDSLLLYTDGVSEASNQDDKLYGMVRLRRVLSKALNTSAAKTIEIVSQDLEHFRGLAALSDDITQLVIRRL